MPADLDQSRRGVAQHHAFEVRALAEQAGHEEAEDGPDVGRTVLEGRSRDGDAVVGLHGQARLGGLGFRVLDGLGFVQDGVTKLRHFQQIGVPA